LGAKGTVVGEVVFNTAITGYQEILTDPSYYKQFVCFTHPHIGNTGINYEDDESEKCWMKGCIVRDSSFKVSNYRSNVDLCLWLKKHGVIGISDVDTRQITRIIRNRGCINGVISTDKKLTVEQLVGMAKTMDINGLDLVRDATIQKIYRWKTVTEKVWEFSRLTNIKHKENSFHLVAYDFGVKFNILRRLSSHGCIITVVPANTKAEDVLKMSPDGVLFSNGAGNPSVIPYAVETCRNLIGKVPTFGICLGHQIMGIAFGGHTYKLPFGHHGGNHPIRHLPSGRIEISSHNHNFAVNPETLPKEIEITHVNINDGTCAGMIWREKMAMSIQYHPEAGPGPHDADLCFVDFINMMRDKRVREKETL
jgi:carbamoyl-phosphate synthase small subunit